MRLLFRIADVCSRGFTGMSIAAAAALFSKKPPPRQRIILRGAGVRLGV